MVGGIGEVPGPPVALPAAEPPTSRVDHPRDRELRDPDGGGGPGRRSGRGCGLGQCRGVHGVPLGEDLVVESGPDAARPGGEEAPSPDLHVRGPVQRRADRPAQDRGPLEVPAWRDVEPGGDGIDHPGVVDADSLGDESGGPDVEFPLHPLGVGVLGGVHPSFGGGQVTGNVGDDPVHDLPVPGIAGHLPAVEEGAEQARLVVEHLLEVGDQPLGVGCVAGEAAAEVVVDAPGGHGVEGAHGHGLGRSPTLGATGPQRLAQGDVDQRRLGELGRATESAPLGVEPRRPARRRPASGGREVRRPNCRTVRVCRDGTR